MYGIYLSRRIDIRIALLVPILLLSTINLGITLTTTTQTSTPMASITAALGKISPTLLGEIQAQGEAPINVVVETYTSDYSTVVADINTLGGKVGHKFEYINALSASMPAERIVQLANNENIAKIYFDSEMTLSTMKPPEMAATVSRDADSLDLLVDSGVVLEGEYMTTSLTSAEIGAIEPANYWNPLSMNAYDVWDLGYFGQGSMVAIIDTGIWTGHFMFWGTSVVDGIDMSDDVGNATYEGWDNPLNDAHGSHVAGILASTGGLIVPPTYPIAIAIELYSGMALPPAPPGYPLGWKLIPLLGMAPFADLYIIKVFDHTGAGVPFSYVNAAMEHAINLKASGTYDIDVLSMSLGGPTMYDGRALQEQLADVATSVGITVVASSGNDGPAPMTAGSPSTANTAISVGAAATPVQTRVYWDYVYWADYGWPAGSGVGYLLYTSENPQVHAMSNRGPTGDGRQKPEVVATGMVVLSAYIPGGVGGLAWFSGTSMAAPAVSGAVALLNGYAEMNLPAATPEDYKQAIMKGAVQLTGYTRDDQGAGYLNAGNALDALKKDKKLGDVAKELPQKGEMPDITTIPIKGSGVFTAKINGIKPGHKMEFIFEITRATDSIRLDITNVDLGVDLGMNSFEVYIQSAKRAVYDYYIETANVWGDAAFLITDDSTTWSGYVYGVYWSSFTIEPGYMKITIENDWTSYDNLSGDIRIEVTEEEMGPHVRITGEIEANEFIGWIPIAVPAGTTQAIVELGWKHDWSNYPTIDLDMYIYWDMGYNYEGASWNGLERVVLDNPTILYILLYGFPSDPSYGLDYWEPPEPFTLTIRFIP